jgi:hypothetical protein
MAQLRTVLKLPSVLAPTSSNGFTVKKDGLPELHKIIADLKWILA